MFEIKFLFLTAKKLEPHFTFDYICLYWRVPASILLVLKVCVYEPSQCETESLAGPLLVCKNDSGAKGKKLPKIQL